MSIIVLDSPIALLISSIASLVRGGKGQQAHSCEPPPNGKKRYILESQLALDRIFGNKDD